MVSTTEDSGQDWRTFAKAIRQTLLERAVSPGFLLMKRCSERTYEISITPMVIMRLMGFWVHTIKKKEATIRSNLFGLRYKLSLLFFLRIFDGKIRVFNKYLCSNLDQSKHNWLIEYIEDGKNSENFGFLDNKSP